MKETKWTAEFPASILVCDLDGIILEMNEKAADMYRAYGGTELLGKSILDCHPEPSRSKLLKLLQTGERNAYTIEKSGVRKFIFQSPWYRNGERRGIVELAVEIPPDVPHFLRA